MEEGTIKPSLKVIEFKRSKEEEIPKFIAETLELILTKVKEGKLKTIICHFNHQEKEEDMLQGGTMFWNYNQNPVEILGLMEVMKSSALDFVHDSIHGEEEDE
jgi:hypothetical protein